MNYDDFSNPRLAIVDEVVTTLVHEAGVDPAAVMLLGAEARDIIHARLGHQTGLRSTTDLDLGLALKDWSAFEAIDSRMTRTGSTGIRYMIAGVAVDVMPFGPVENPEGIVTPTRQHEDLVVFGFGDVFERADTIRLPKGDMIRIPQPAGYAVLKLRAWLDRLPHHEHKDAVDLATSL